MSEWSTARARVASLTRSRKPNDPELVEARQQLKAARLAEHVRKAVESAPPLSQEQLAQIASLLRAGGDGRG